MSNIIDINDVTKTYNMGDAKVHALNSVNLQISEGEFVALMGPSGSGKSTLLHIIGCLDKQTSGKVKVLKKEISKLNENERTDFRKNHIGFIFQFFNLIPVLNVAENVVVSRMFDRDKLPQRVFELIGLVGLEHRLEHLPSELSGGERQRLAIARALINNPTIIIADEPTGNLDIKTTKEIMQIFRNINKKGTTIIVATHNPMVSKSADKIIKISDGRILV
ncbi:ABC transporter ATP-binding protein [[Eubacterium] cellulosolvens]